MKKAFVASLASAGLGLTTSSALATNLSLIHI